MEYGNSILVPFDMVYDIDIGIFKLIKTAYRNPAFIDMMMLQITNNNFKHLMLKMPQYDPLSVVLKDEYKNNSMSILNDILTTEYNKMIQLAEPTDILGLLAIYRKTSLVKISILCKTEAEAKIIKDNNLLKDISTIIEEDYSKIDISKYDSIFIKDYRNVLKLRQLEGKSIFVGKYKFNIDEESDHRVIPLTEISALVADVNRIYLIELYNTDDTYPIYG